MRLAVRLWCTLTPVVLWGQSSSGTTGVAISTPDRAVLAMDSRVTLSDGEVVRRGPDECKIKAIGRFYVAIAGLYDHAATKFDAWRLAEEAVAGGRSVTEAVAMAARRIEPELRTAMWNMAGRYSRAHLAILVAGMDGGSPAIAGREFAPDADGVMRVVRWEGAPGIFAFGEHAAIDEAYRDTLARSASLVAAARSLVQMEIDRGPGTVGPPISILEITKDGPRWAQAGLCRLGDTLRRP